MLKAAQFQALLPVGGSEVRIGGIAVMPMLFDDATTGRGVSPSIH